MTGKERVALAIKHNMCKRLNAPAMLNSRPEWLGYVIDKCLSTHMLLEVYTNLFSNTHVQCTLTGLHCQSDRLIPGRQPRDGSLFIHGEVGLLLI